MKIKSFNCGLWTEETHIQHIKMKHTSSSNMQRNINKESNTLPL